MAQEQLYDPRTGGMVDVNDISAQAEAVTKANPVSAEVIEALRESRRKGLGVLDTISRFLSDAGLGFFARIFIILAIKIAKLLPFPAKLAVGTILGVPIIKLGFDTETTMYWYAVPPKTLGGNSGNRIYLTSTNQAGAGPEGLVMYEKNMDAVFCAVDNRGTVVRSIPYSDSIYKDHTIKLKINGTEYSTLYIAIRTFGKSTTWTNQVLLFNPSTSQFDSMWKSDPFTWDPSQTGSRIWGPVIEITSEAGYGKTNPIGFADARLVVDKGGKVVVWVLDNKNSHFGRNAEFQFDVRFQDGHHTMIAD